MGWDENWNVLIRNWSNTREVTNAIGVWILYKYRRFRQSRNWRTLLFVGIRENATRCGKLIRVSVMWNGRVDSFNLRVGMSICSYIFDFALCVRCLCYNRRMRFVISKPYIVRRFLGAPNVISTDTKRESVMADIHRFIFRQWGTFEWRIGCRR